MLLKHFFNHQTHHRGQVAILLCQMNIDIGETDLLILISDVDDDTVYREYTAIVFKNLTMAAH